MKDRRDRVSRLRSVTNCGICASTAFATGLSDARPSWVPRATRAFCSVRLSTAFERQPTVVGLYRLQHASDAEFLYPVSERNAVFEEPPDGGNNRRCIASMVELGQIGFEIRAPAQPIAGRGHDQRAKGARRQERAITIARERAHMVQRITQKRDGCDRR